MSVVLITGCSTGIGRTVAIALARQGHTVYATMRNPARASDLRLLGEREGLDLRLAALDVTDDDSVRRVVSTIVDETGRLDAAVNNAGVAPFSPIEHTTDADWLATFDTNVFGTARVARAVMPVMRRQGSGLIVNVSSVAGRLAPLPTQSVYAASKHAVCALTDSIATEGAAFGIRAVCIEPGIFATSIMEKDTVIALASDDPYRAMQDHIEAVFRSRVAVAQPPDAVADAIVGALNGTLAPGTHHVVGFEDLAPSQTSARA